MKSQQYSAETVWQNPANDASHTYKILRQHLAAPETKRFRVAVAYVSWGGLSLVSDAIEAFLRRGGIMETIYGVENGITTPDALLYSIYLQRQFPGYRAARAYRWEFIDSEFHAKYFEFDYGGHAVCLIGSGNLTSGGMACNHELATALSSPSTSPVRNCLDNCWGHYFKGGEVITPTMVRAMKHSSRTGSEQRSRAKGEGVKALGLKLPRANKPLFQHILEDGASRQTRHDILAEGDVLSEKPAALYLQILERETGGGHQIQLPVATLGAFFGVGAGETRNVEFVFPALRDSATVEMTHFGNNTHRIRLRPLKDIPRPSIVVFNRTESPDRYECLIVPQGRYSSTLRNRCPEQTREGSRFWGFGE